MTIHHVKNLIESTKHMSNGEVQPPHILIVDDDPDQLRLLVTALRHASYRVSVALNGDQGYARATVLLPDLVLLDVRMPGRNGLAIARLLKTNPATQHIPVLFLSAMAGKNERLEGLRAGGVDYISKPFHVEEVLERTRIHLAISLRKNSLSLEKIDIEKSPLKDHSPLDSSPANLTLKQVATEYILSQIHEPSLKSSDVSSHLGISLHRLNAIFEKYSGISAFEFIRKERMRRAALILGQSTLTIADAAMEVGYSNPANFSTEFKKFWDRSPTQLRNEYQENPEIMQKLISEKIK